MIKFKEGFLVLYNLVGSIKKGCTDLCTSAFFFIQGLSLFSSSVNTSCSQYLWYLLSSKQCSFDMWAGMLNIFSFNCTGLSRITKLQNHQILCVSLPIDVPNECQSIFVIDGAHISKSVTFFKTEIDTKTFAFYKYLYNFLVSMQCRCPY